MNRRDLLTLSGAVAAVALAGCGAGGRGPDGTGTPTESPTDEPTDAPTSDPDGDGDRLAALAAVNAGFALDLHRHVAEERDNLFPSPYSISVAFAMTYAGARGETEEQMRETLHSALGEEIHPAFADVRAALESRAPAEDPAEGDEVDAFQLAVANALGAGRPAPSSTSTWT